MEPSKGIPSKGVLQNAKALEKARAERRLTPAENAARIKALQQEAQLSWAEEGDSSTGLRVIVLKNLFTQEEVAAGAWALFSDAASVLPLSDVQQ